jgi:hypothetical protein
MLSTRTLEDDRRAILSRLDSALDILEEALAADHLDVDQKIVERVVGVVSGIHVGMPMTDAIELTLTLQEPFLLHPEDPRQDRCRRLAHGRRHARDLNAVIGPPSAAAFLAPAFHSRALGAES